MATNRLLFGRRVERSHPYDKADGGHPRSPRLPFVVVVFFTVVISFGISSVLSILMNPPIPPRTQPPTPESPAPRISLTTPEFDVETFKRTIIDNNIFRPLGWTPPRPVEPYRLIGTLLPRGANSLAQAVIESTSGKAISIVSVGEPLDPETTVVSIESKSVVLESGGVRRSLRLPPVF